MQLANNCNTSSHCIYFISQITCVVLSKAIIVTSHKLCNFQSFDCNVKLALEMLEIKLYNYKLFELLSTTRMVVGPEPNFGKMLRLCYDFP